MLYNYGEIIGFSPDRMIKALDYFKEAEEAFIERMSKVEAIHIRIQEDFDILHPNISFFINSYEFDKDRSLIYIDDSILLSANGFNIEASGNNIDVDIYDNTVVPLDSIEKSIPYFESLFLDRSVKNHTVFWTYDLESPSIFTDLMHYEGIDIVPIGAISADFYLKVEESFGHISSIGSKSGERNIVTKKICETFFNNLSNSNIYCNTNTILGNTFALNENSLYLQEEIFAISDKIIFSSSFVFQQNSPVSTEYAEANFAKKNLSNITKLQLTECDIGDRGDNELVSNLNMAEVMDSLFNITDSIIDDSFKIEISGANNAASFKSLLQTCTTFLNSFYTDKLRMFLSNYSDFGALSEMLDFLQKSINDLGKSFVKNDECEIPLSIKDEGCDIPCDNIYFDEPNLMVTKQKLKAILICSLKCDTMPYTEYQLAARSSPLPGRSILTPGGETAEVPEE